MAKKDEKTASPDDKTTPDAATDDKTMLDAKSAVPATVAMKRALLPGQKGPVTADVHPDEVDGMRRFGWHLSTE